MKKGVSFPVAAAPKKVGAYAGVVHSGGGLVWDAVLEYRVWCHPERGAPDVDGGNDYFRAFATFDQALAFCRETPGAEEPLALVLQKEYIAEPSLGRYVHVRERRITEWPVEFLCRPRRTKATIPDFLSSDAPTNRLDILRGLAPRPRRRRAGTGA